MSIFEKINRLRRAHGLTELRHPGHAALDEIDEVTRIKTDIILPKAVGGTSGLASMQLRRAATVGERVAVHQKHLDNLPDLTFWLGVEGELRQ